MNRDVVLLDTQHARIFRLGTGVGPENLRFGHPDHHTHRQTHEDKESIHFYAEVATHLRDADEILVVGHGIAKTHFHTFLAQHEAVMAKKVVGYETVDHPTDGQIVALAIRYFRRVETTRAERGA